MSIGNVMEDILTKLGQAYPLREQSAGEYALLKVKGMHFSIKRYYAEGFGNVSVMEAVGFFGLMKMDTLIINPIKKDLPLYSYDRILAMGNDTLIVELYDTLLEPTSYPEMLEVKKKFRELPERDPGAHWYDDIKLAESISKKGKKAQTPEFNKMALQHLEAYLKSAPQKDVSNEAMIIKGQKASDYVEGLLKQGGPSTDVFMKELGAEKTAYLFRKILFGTDTFWM